MKRVTDLLFFWLSIVGFSVAMLSCERTADVEFPEYKSVLVLHGYMAVGDSFKVALGKTLRADVPVIDTNTYVDNGLVLLYEDNVLKDTMKFNPHERRYVSGSVVATSGKVYKVVATAPGFLSVEAQTRAPFPIPTLSISHMRNTRTDNNGNILDDVRVVFADPAAETNFYFAELNSPWGSVCIYSSDPSVERLSSDFLPADFGYCLGSRIVYADHQFAGQQKELTVSAVSLQLRTFVSPTGAVYKPYIKRYHVPEDYYKYYKTSRSSGGEGFTLSNPVVVRGNVKNGYGLFTVFSVTTDSLP